MEVLVGVGMMTLIIVTLIGGIYGACRAAELYQDYLNITGLNTLGSSFIFGIMIFIVLNLLWIECNLAQYLLKIFH